MRGVKGTVVIDPGHGGTGTIDHSDGNHAVSPSGVLETLADTRTVQPTMRLKLEHRTSKVHTLANDCEIHIAARVEGGGDVGLTAPAPRASRRALRALAACGRSSCFHAAT
jgi:hypothetical protein